MLKGRLTIFIATLIAAWSACFAILGSTSVPDFQLYSSWTISNCTYQGKTEETDGNGNHRAVFKATFAVIDGAANPNNPWKNGTGIAYDSATGQFFPESRQYQLDRYHLDERDAYTCWYPNGAINKTTWTKTNVANPSGGGVLCYTSDASLVNVTATVPSCASILSGPGCYEEGTTVYCNTLNNGKFLTVQQQLNWSFVIVPFLFMFGLVSVVGIALSIKLTPETTFKLMKIGPWEF